MNESVLLWLSVAVLLFWWIGAYNRLVRLRAQCLVAFTALERQFQQHVQLVDTHLPGSMAADIEQDPLQADNDTVEAWRGLAAAAGQFTASLKVARAHPLKGETMRALQTAFETLCMSWSTLQNLPPDLAGPTLPASLQAQWEHIALQVDMARSEFTRAVVSYNEAIDQFPALLLAWVFGFKPAQPV